MSCSFDGNFVVVKVLVGGITGDTIGSLSIRVDGGKAKLDLSSTDFKNRWGIHRVCIFAEKVEVQCSDLTEDALIADVGSSSYGLSGAMDHDHMHRNSK